MLSSTAFVHFNRKADALLATTLFVYEPRQRLRHTVTAFRQTWRSKRTSLAHALDSAGGRLAFALADLHFMIAGHRDDADARRVNPALHPAVAA